MKDNIISVDFSKRSKFRVKVKRLLTLFLRKIKKLLRIDDNKSKFSKKKHKSIL